MHVSAVARDRVDLEAVTGALARHHVKIHTLSRYFLGPQTKTGLVLGYGTVDLAEIRRGMSMLSAILRN
jgi:GntR family transcriptional regulator/MocR family aminotransferase